MALILEPQRIAAQALPPDWTLRRLSDVAEANWGNTAITKSSYQNSGYAAYSASGPDGFVSWYEHDKPAVVLSAIGAQCGKTWFASGKWTPIKNTIWFAANVTQVDTRFLYYITANPDFWPNRGQAQPFIALGDVRNALVPMPPTKAEQEAIAEALSDADAYVESLEQLIAKKRLVKQGAMQDLLMGERRLAGFNGDWIKKPIGEILTIAHGKNQKMVEDRNGTVPILATGGQIGTANRFLYDKPSVLIGRKGTIDQPQFMESPFWTVDTLFYSRLHEPNIAKFVYYRLCLIEWKRYNEASGVPSLNAKTIEAIEISVPGSDEQIAIAKILSDMDSELNVLQTKLGKARDIKQGMMQNLLTGRIRLV